jgi:hypothetical protein
MSIFLVPSLPPDNALSPTSRLGSAGSAPDLQRGMARMKIVRWTVDDS